MMFENTPNKNALKVKEEFNSNLNEMVITITHHDKIILSFVVDPGFMTSEFELLLDELPNIYRLGVVDGVGCMHNSMLKENPQTQGE